MKLRVVAVLLVAFGCKGRRDEAAHAPARTATGSGDPSGLAEVGPHPDYPTPRAAGTDKIFLTEEPDRGPPAPVDARIPAPGGMTWTRHEHCVDDVIAFVCSPPTARPTGMRTWRVGRSAGVVVAHEERAGQRDVTHVYLTKADGTPDQHLEFDEHQRVQSARLFTGDRRYSSRNRDGSNAFEGCGYMGYAVDDDQRVTELRCLQWLGEPMRDMTGVALTRYLHDAEGFTREEHRHGIAGSPVAGTDGVTRLVHELDDVGRRVATRHQDADGSPVADETGCHGTRFERDERGLLQRRSCLDAHGGLARALTGIASDTYQHDDHGCQTQVRHFDLAGAPAVDHAGVHGTNLERDRDCQVTSRTCIGADGEPVACRPGQAARTIFKRDAHGNSIVERTYDRALEPLSSDDNWGAFEIRNTWNRLGNITRIACWNEQGRPTTCGITEFHAKESAYDEAGREISEIYFDVAGRRTKNIGITMRRFHYDNYDHTFEARNYDEHGALVDALGYATRRDVFDDAHRLFGVLLFDHEDKPASYTGCFGGTTCPEDSAWHAVRIQRRADGSVRKNQFFDAAGQLLETFDCSVAMCFED